MRAKLQSAIDATAEHIRTDAPRAGETPKEVRVGDTVELTLSLIHI